jgi:hypothetical protein
MLWQLNFYELVGGEPPPPLLGQSRICQRVGGGSSPSLHFCVCVCMCRRPLVLVLLLLCRDAVHWYRGAAFRRTAALPVVGAPSSLYLMKGGRG